jgi:ketosteroid isomerase-like protein
MRPAVLVVAYLVVTAGCSQKPAATPADSSVQQAGAPNDVASVQRAIDSAETRFSTALMKGDTAGISSIYADDAVILAPNMKAARDRASRSQMHAAMLKDVTYPSVSLKSEDLIVSGDYGIETGAYRMTIQPKGAKPMEDVGKFISIWKKQPDGSWKMIRDMFSSDLPAK